MRLNNLTAEVSGSKARVENYLKEKEDYFKKKRDVERLKMRVGLLQRQLRHRERLEKEGGWVWAASASSGIGKESSIVRWNKELLTRGDIEEVVLFIGSFGCYLV